MLVSSLSGGLGRGSNKYKDAMCKVHWSEMDEEARSRIKFLSFIDTLK